MQIGPKVIELMERMAGELLTDHADEINRAFLKSEDGGLKVVLSFDLGVSQTKVNGVDVDATISFTAEKVKEKRGQTIVENQVELFKAAGE